MRIAVTGGTGFVGGHFAARLSRAGHETVLVARGADRRDLARRDLAGARFVAAGVDDEEALARAFEGCAGVAHCAGINREIGAQTYETVHVRGTCAVVRAARRAGVVKVALVSFLRARPDCGSPYHESKWRAEEIVRASGLDYTILRPGVIYGRGDHMLDHLSRALRTFPVFALVGRKDTSCRPVAVEDVARVLEASLVEGRLSRKTVAVLGPEEMSLAEAVRRVARAVGRSPRFVRAPVSAHLLAAWVLERTMRIPLISRAQVRILAEGVVEPALPCDEFPGDLQPRTSFDLESIRAGLPGPGGFGLRDCRCVDRARLVHGSARRAPTARS
jgi:NADH dehydrogenase